LNEDAGRDATAPDRLPGEGAEGPRPHWATDDAGLTRRVLGAPWLFAIAYSAVGFSIYFALGVVAERGLGLTPLIFLAAGLLFVLTIMTYIEGGFMYRDRGGSSTLARHAFNELVSFIAGWAILIDYMIVIALAAVSTPHYLGPLWDEFTHGAGEVLVAVGVVAVAAAINARGHTGQGRQGMLIGLALADIVLQLLVIVIGAAVVWDPAILTAELDLFTAPSLEDAIYALVIATVAFAGIEAASDLAPDLDFRPRDLTRVVSATALLLPLAYAGIAAVALMALPVTPGPEGPRTPLGGPFIDDPVLGVVQSYDPGWLSNAMEVAVVAVAPVVLIWAATATMLGLSRHVYVLATNRQIPSWLGKLGRVRATPFVAIWSAAAICVALVIPGDIEMLAGVYAFGATLAIALAHLSIVRLRMTQPERSRPFRVPLDVNVGGKRLPAPALLGAVLMGLAWVSVIAFHDTALYVGGGWMVFGVLGYVVYRTVVEKTSLTRRVTVPAAALVKEAAEIEYGDILVPVFGTKLDDDIVGTAGRLADAALSPGETPPRLEVVYVVDLPLTVPLDAPPPRERMGVANAALERAQEVAEEYETVEVGTSMVRARGVGAGIVQAARERGVEVIVMGGEPPTKVRGGAILGGIGGHRPDEIGPVTEYVLRKAPCPVLVTAPPAEKVATRAIADGAASGGELAPRP
jgi:APA family basic amino acid/polyamine antiporter